MGAQIIGASLTAAEVETLTKALRTVQRPLDVGALGSFRKAMRSGTIGAGLTAASRVYAARFNPTPSTNLAVIRNIRLSMGDLAAFTAGFVSIDFFVSRSFTVFDSSGGTAGTVTGNNGKMRTSFTGTDAMQYYMATTAAISGNTDVLDTDPFATVSFSISAAAAGAPLLSPIDVFKPQGAEWPLILASGEGIVAKATVPATGTWDLGIEIAHDEVLAGGF